MIDLNDMVLFAEVVDRLGFSAAGRALKVPKSTISRRISQLEDRLGIRLLERTTRRMHLTEIGEVFYRHCKRLREEAADAELSVQRMLEIPRGLLRIGASVTTGQYLLGPLSTEFAARYPEVYIDLQLSNRHMDLIEEGFDMIIRAGELPDSSAIAKFLGESRFFAYASPAYLTARGTPAALADLRDHDCIIMTDPQTIGAWLPVGSWDALPFPVSPRIVANDFPTLRRIICDGGGIAVLPRLICLEDEAQGRLTPILTHWSLPPVRFHALYPSHRGATPKVRAMLDFLGARLGKQLSGGDAV